MSNAVKQAKERIRKFLRQWESTGRRNCIAGAPDDAARCFVELMVEDLRAVVSEPEPVMLGATLQEFDIEAHLRDGFATSALNGILSNEGFAGQYLARDCDRAYQCADAMLLARKRGVPE